MTDTMYRRSLPHRRRLGATYFVTWRLHREQNALDGAERASVFHALRFFDGDRYALEAAVVMDDHVHVVMAPHPSHQLESIVQSWKSFTSKWLMRTSRRKSPVWQAEYFDRIVRDEAEVREKVSYTARNPWKRWPTMTTYEWVMPQPEMVALAATGGTPVLPRS